MSAPREDWPRFAVKAIAMGVVVLAAAFVGTSLANARDGVAGGAARSFLTVSGTLTGVSGTTMAVFHFVRAESDGGTREMCAPTVPITPDATTHAFSAEVPIDSCGAGFDGSDVTVTVDVGGTAGVVSGARVNPVPYAQYASQYGTPFCPVGYDYASPGETVVLCTRGSGDQIVRVGTGPSAFWIDRWEASVFARRDGSGAQYLGTGAAYPITIDGQWAGTTPPAYAVSAPGVLPSVNISGFQAAAACRASGKRLPTRDEWLAAARGTPDPTSANDGAANTLCNTGGTTLRRTNAGTGCLSAWGAQDMIGNIIEWTDEWYAGIGDGTGRDQVLWPSVDSTVFGGDEVTNISSSARSAGVATPYIVRGLPAATLRGGRYSDQTRGGLFSMELTESPQWNAGTGFRCVIPR